MKPAHSIIGLCISCSGLWIVGPGFAQEPPPRHQRQAGACTLAEEGWRVASESAQAYPGPIQPGDEWLCFGWDDDTHQCLLYFANEEICERLQPCWLPLATIAQ